MNKEYKWESQGRKTECVAGILQSKCLYSLQINVSGNVISKDEEK